MAKITVLYNTNPMAMAISYDYKDVMTAIWQMQFPTTYVDSVVKRDTVLADIFSAFNDEELPDGVTRSISVGDAVIFDVEGEEYAYSCGSFGWNKVNVKEMCILYLLKGGK